jgi:hypothetical protein
MLDHEPISYLVDLIRVNETPLPALLYIPTEGAPFGYRFIWIEPAGDGDVPNIDISPETSIGMLYAALQPCGEYVPAEWSRPVRFERVPV